MDFVYIFFIVSIDIEYLLNEMHNKCCSTNRSERGFYSVCVNT